LSDIDDIKARTDIVDLVSSYVALQKSGSTFKAVCPFHTEKTPSFIVNPERQSWHCFGACGTGGDAFSFVMRKENLDFGGALRLLAQRAGVELRGGGDRQRDDSLYRVTRAAARFYQDTLSSDAGDAGRAYLKARGVDKQTSEKFTLGLSTDSRDGLKSYLLTHDFTMDDAVRAGLVTRAENGNTWDFFRGRLMFPISDRRGNITGFGARALDDSNPKYINTASTPIFDKRGTLYGLDLAMESVRSTRTVVIVEGYMDAIAAHQHGYDNVVASMGTALTEQQVSQLRSLADRFILALDPDAAGQAATLRSLESAWHVIQSTAAVQRQRSQSALRQLKSVDLRIVALPQGQDPDALIREDRARWDQLTSDALPLLDYMIPKISSGFDLTADSGRVQVVDIIWPLIRSLDDLDQDHYLQQLALAIGVTIEALRASLGRRSSEGDRDRQRQRPESPRQVTRSALVGAGDDALEDYAMAVLVGRPGLAATFSDFNVECLRKIENRQVFTKLLSCSTIDCLRESIDESLHQHLEHLTNFGLIATDPAKGEAAVTQMLKRLEDRYWREVQETLLSTYDPRQPPPRELEAEVASVNARIRESEPMRASPA
jgi:DNA primase